MKRDTGGWISKRSSRQLNLLPLVHPLRLYLEAGTALPEALRRLSTRLPGPLRPMAQALAAETARGESLADALKPWNHSLPPEVAALLVAGEASGRLPEILERIETHLQAEAQSRQRLASALVWPVLQAFLAMGLLLLVGLIQAMLGAGRGTPGFGWAAFLPFLLVIVSASAIAWNWRRLPVVASALVHLERARLAGTLGLALDSGLSPGKALDLAATAADRSHWKASVVVARKRLRDGMGWRSVLSDWPDLDPDFLVAVENGEITGQLPECLARQATLDRDQGERIMAHALQLLACMAWVLSAGAIVFNIFRFYLGYISLLTG